jgi:hypothetical protein
MICRPSGAIPELAKSTAVQPPTGSVAQLCGYFGSINRQLYSRGLAAWFRFCPPKSSAVIITGALIASRRRRFTFGADNPRG